MSWDRSEYDNRPESILTTEPSWWEQIDLDRAALAAAEDAERRADDEQHERMLMAQAPQLAYPIGHALDSWLRSQRAATAPRYAEIANGLFVRVGTGRKNNRRAA